MEEDSPPIHRNMAELCSGLIKDKFIKSQKVYDTIMQVDRADFAPTNPYQDEPQRIGYNVVISAPHLHAYCLEALKDFLTEGSTALDIGFGSGYLTVAMSKMMNDKGKVIGIEHIKDLYNWGINNISKHHQNLIDNKTIELVLGDGRLGYKAMAPYKCMHVGAYSREVPNELIEQLACGGRLVMPLGEPDDHYIYCVDKDLNGKLKFTKGLSVCYVSLTSVKNQLKGIE